VREDQKKQDLCITITIPVTQTPQGRFQTKRCAGSVTLSLIKTRRPEFVNSMKNCINGNNGQSIYQMMSGELDLFLILQL